MIVSGANLWIETEAFASRWNTDLTGEIVYGKNGAALVDEHDGLRERSPHGLKGIENALLYHLECS
jgi:hypothetical protein